MNYKIIQVAATADGNNQCIQAFVKANLLKWKPFLVCLKCYTAAFYIHIQGIERLILSLSGCQFEYKNKLELFLKH